jgi:hypothetical protein
VRGTQCLFPGDLVPGNGICEQFCAGESDCTQPAVAVGSSPLPSNRPHCLFPAAGGSRLCSVACNPVGSQGPSGCPSGSVCVYGTSASFIEFTFCDRAGTGTDGEPCNASNRCAEGFNCVDNPTQGIRCRALCRAGTNSDCTKTGYTCNPGAGGNPPMFGYCCPTTGC